MIPVRRVCAAIVRGGAILMVQHTHDGLAYWTLPGGGVLPGETLEEAVVREVEEETGLVGRAGDRLYEADGEACFAVAIAAGAEARLGFDPELPRDRQILAGIAWRPLAELGDDRQIARILASAPAGLSISSRRTRS